MIVSSPTIRVLYVHVQRVSRCASGEMLWWATLVQSLAGSSPRALCSLGTRTSSCGNTCSRQPPSRCRCVRHLRGLFHFCYLIFIFRFPGFFGIFLESRILSKFCLTQLRVYFSTVLPIYDNFIVFSEKKKKCKNTNVKKNKPLVEWGLSWVERQDAACKVG